VYTWRWTWIWMWNWYMSQAPCYTHGLEVIPYNGFDVSTRTWWFLGVEFSTYNIML
jgi:hypothetical protein